MMGLVRTALRGLGHVDLTLEIARGANVMKTVTTFLVGPFRNAFRLALQEATAGSHVEDLLRQERGWNLFLLLPQMLLHRGRRGGLIRRDKLARRLDAFARGEWNDLLDASRLCDDQAATARRRGGRRAGDEEKRRALKALALTQMGELSPARQALEGEAVAPGTEETRGALQDPS